MGCGITLPSHLSSTESQLKYPSSVCDSDKLVVDNPLTGIETSEELKDKSEQLGGSSLRVMELSTHDGTDNLTTSLGSKVSMESREYKACNALECNGKYSG